MVKRLTRQGNSIAVILDRPIVEAAQLDEGQEVEINGVESTRPKTRSWIS